MSGLYTPKIELILEQSLALRDRRNATGHTMSDASIARDIGVSPASLSNFFQRKEVGDPEKMAKRLKEFIDNERARDEASLLTVPYTETRQAKKMMQGIKFAHQNNRLVAIVSPAGTGKSSTVQEAQRRDPSILCIRAATFYGPHAILQELCEVLRMPQTGTCRALMKRIKAKLAGTNRCLIIDDAHDLRAGGINAVRTVYDETKVGIVLFGIQKLKRILTGVDDESEQIASRVAGRIFEVPEVNEQDLALILAAVMPEQQVETAIQMMRDADPQAISTPRRMCNVLEIAGKIAERKNHQLGIKDIQDAMRLSA